MLHKCTLLLLTKEWQGLITFSCAVGAFIGCNLVLTLEFIFVNYTKSEITTIKVQSSTQCTNCLTASIWKKTSSQAISSNKDPNFIKHIKTSTSIHIKLDVITEAHGFVISRILVPLSD